MPRSEGNEKGLIEILTSRLASLESQQAESGDVTALQGQIDNLHSQVESAQTTAAAAQEAAAQAPMMAQFTGTVNAESHLIVTRRDGSTFDAGYVKGDKGDRGLPGPAALAASIDQQIPVIAVGGLYSFTVSVPGASTSMTATVNPPPSLLSSLSNWRAAVTAADTVTVYLNALLAIAAGKRTFNVRVIQ